MWDKVRKFPGIFAVGCKHIIVIRNAYPGTDDICQLHSLLCVHITQPAVDTDERKVRMIPGNVKKLFIKEGIAAEIERFSFALHDQPKGFHRMVGKNRGDDHIPNGDAEDPEAECERYEASLQDVTIDLQILGLGTDGHIGFNEPGTPFESLTHVAELTEQTRRDNAHYFGGNIELVPKKAISMGLATVMRARRVVVIATGTAKANAVYKYLFIYIGFI